MKPLGIIAIILSSFTGVLSAYAESNSVVFYFVNICGDVFHQYTRLSNYKPEHCAFSFIRPCFYESPVDLGTYTYEASLTAAGARPSAMKGCYVPQ
jgi:hypothetical protein